MRDDGDWTWCLVLLLFLTSRDALIFDSWHVQLKDYWCISAVWSTRTCKWFQSLWVFFYVFKAAFWWQSYGFMLWGDFFASWYHVWHMVFMSRPMESTEPIPGSLKTYIIIRTIRTWLDHPDTTWVRTRVRNPDPQGENDLCYSCCPSRMKISIKRRI